LPLWPAVFQPCSDVALTACPTVSLNFAHRERCIAMLRWQYAYIGPTLVPQRCTPSYRGYRGSKGWGVKEKKTVFFKPQSQLGPVGPFKIGLKLVSRARSAGPVTAVTARSKHKDYKNKAALYPQPNICTKYDSALPFHLSIKCFCV
jgi:hypothetical protein